MAECLFSAVELCPTHTRGLVHYPILPPMMKYFVVQMYVLDRNRGYNSAEEHPRKRINRVTIANVCRVSGGAVDLVALSP